MSVGLKKIEHCYQFEGTLKFRHQFTEMGQLSLPTPSLR